MTKLSDLKSSAQMAADERVDPEVLAELDRTSVAEQVALLLTSYRVEHKLTQTGLADLLGMHQPAVARLEAGTHEPSLAHSLGCRAHWASVLTFTSSPTQWFSESPEIEDKPLFGPRPEEERDLP